MLVFCPSDSFVENGSIQDIITPNGNITHYLILFNEAHEGGALDLDHVAILVVERDYEMKKVALPQVRRRLLVELGATDANNTEQTQGTTLEQLSVHCCLHCA